MRRENNQIKPKETIGKLSFQEQRDLFDKALNSLPEDQRESVKRSVTNLETAIRSKHPTARISKDSMIELLYAIGRVL